jgi:hypothetical protein
MQRRDLTKTAGAGGAAARAAAAAFRLELIKLGMQRR